MCMPAREHVITKDLNDTLIQTWHLSLKGKTNADACRGYNANAE